MPKLQITKDGESHSISPEMTAKECKAQAELVEAAIHPHHVYDEDENGVGFRVTHRPEATGEPETVLDLGWTQILAGVIESCEIID